MPEAVVNVEAFKLKGRLFTITVLQLLCSDLDYIAQELNYIVKKAPRLFQNAPVVLDLYNLSLSTQELTMVCTTLRRYSIIPVGVQGISEEQQEVVLQCGLAVFNASRNRQEQELNLAAATANSASATTASKNDKATVVSKVITVPVRSGQQIYAEGSDLIVVTSVSYGAELLADGNIHVYGTLRGRALAGIKGNKQSRIFCQNLDADLLSIAGSYMVHDTIKQTKPHGPCQVFLIGDKLHIAAL